MPAYGASSWSLIRAVDDPLSVEQARAAIIDLHDLPILPAWHTLVVSE